METEDKFIASMNGALLQARHSFKRFAALKGGCIVLIIALVAKLLLGQFAWIDLLVTLITGGLLYHADTGQKYLVGIWGENILVIKDQHVAMGMLRKAGDNLKARGW